MEKLLLPQVTICPTTPMTVDVARLMFVMRSNPQFRNLENKTMVDFTYFMLAGSGFQVRISLANFQSFHSFFPCFAKLNVSYSEICFISFLC